MVKPRLTDPRRIDVEAFAEAGASLQGEAPLTGFERLAAALHPDAQPQAGNGFAWQARGERRPTRGGGAQTRLHLGAQGRVPLICQRCLAPVEVAIDVERDFLFVADEALAAELDADSDEDVLATSRAFDLLTLLEDEVLLALPLVPRHDVCPQPLVAPTEAAEPADEPPHPFAALQALRGRGPAN